LYFFDNIEPSY
jgi:hypothetical protein